VQCGGLRCGRPGHGNKRQTKSGRAIEELHHHLLWSKWSWFQPSRMLPAIVLPIVTLGRARVNDVL
jgi:hypothetical protein